MEFRTTLHDEVAVEPAPRFVRQPGRSRSDRDPKKG